jgi:hypothetical protein
MKAKLKFITTLLIAAVLLSGCELNISNQNYSNMQYLDEINYTANNIEVGTEITEYDFIDDESIQTIKHKEDDGSFSEIRCIKFMNKSEYSDSTETIHDFQFDSLEVTTKKNSDIINTVKLTLYNCNKISRTDFVEYSEQIFGESSFKITEEKNSYLWPMQNSDDDQTEEDINTAKFSHSLICSHTENDSPSCIIEYHEMNDCELCEDSYHSVLSIEYRLSE